jgi:hypothetical protein
LCVFIVYASLTTPIRAVNGDKKSRTDGDGAYVRRNGIKVKTDLFGKHAPPDALLWFLGVYYGKKETCKANKQSLLQAVGLEEEGACLNDRTWYLKSSRSQLFGKKVQAQYFEGAVPKRDHAAYQGSQPASGCPVCPLRNHGCSG